MVIDDIEDLSKASSIRAQMLESAMTGFPALQYCGRMIVHQKPPFSKFEWDKWFFAVWTTGTDTHNTLLGFLLRTSWGIRQEKEPKYMSYRKKYQTYVKPCVIRKLLKVPWICSSRKFAKAVWISHRVENPSSKCCCDRAREYRRRLWLVYRATW